VDRRTLAWLALLAPVAVFVAVYLPAVGHGFIRDDYQWVRDSRIGSVADLGRLFHQDNGFYRPAVALTFAVDHWLFGLRPLAYGLTNLMLALACAGAIASLARGCGLPRGAAWFAAMLWLLNVHGIGMAVLWISGRTALLLTLAATMAAGAFVRGRVWAAAGWMFIALFAKEEALALPFVLAVWWAIERRHGIGRAVSLGWWVSLSLAAEGAYLLLRTTTHAMTPASAPSFYQLTLNPAGLLRNVIEYADRAGSVAAGVVLIAWLLLGRPSAGFDDRTRAVLKLAAVWVAGMFAITLWLPARSDLYACCPSVGVALAAAAACAAWWPSSAPERRRTALVASVAVSVVIGIVCWMRTPRWVEPASFASAALADLARETAALPDRAVVVLDDDRRQLGNLSSAFDEGLDEAFTLMTGRRLRFWIEPAIDPDLVPPCPGCAAMRLAVVDGRLRPAPGR
jgi:hypothetical protein